MQQKNTVSFMFAQTFNFGQGRKFGSVPIVNFPCYWAFDSAEPRNHERFYFEQFVPCKAYIWTILWPKWCMPYDKICYKSVHQQQKFCLHAFSLPLVVTKKLSHSTSHKWLLTGGEAAVPLSGLTIYLKWLVALALVARLRIIAATKNWQMQR